MKFIQKGNRILCKNEVPVPLKRKIAALLNQLLKDYKLKSKLDEDLSGFKGTFKGNLHILLDNEYHTKKAKK